MDSLTSKKAGQKPFHAVPFAVVCVGVLLFLVLLSGVLSIGDRLYALHPLLAGVFYIVVVLLIALGIALPLVRIAAHPIFSLRRLRDSQGAARLRWCRRLAKNLAQNADLAPGEISELQDCLGAGEQAPDRLIVFFEKYVVPRIDAQTKRYARIAFSTTAVSQSSLVDAFTMLTLGFDLVKSIVESCGFRPTNLVLFRLYLRVMAGAMVAGSLEDMDLEALVAGALGNGSGGHLSGLLMASAAQGFVNAFLMFRIGCLTKRYLCTVEGPTTMAFLRKGSYADALALMRSSGFVGEALNMVKDKAASAASSVADKVKTAARDAANTAVAGVGNVVRAASKPRRFPSSYQGAGGSGECSELLNGEGRL